MKQFFDTSVLIAAFVADEANHEPCADLLANATEGYVYSHGLAECFSILTGNRFMGRVSANVAAEMLRVNVAERMEVVSLSAGETLEALEKAQPVGVRGGGIYDFLHLTAARKGNVDEIYTLNLRHFEAFAPDLREIIRKP